MTVVQLKVEMKARGIKQTGRKADLICKLAESLGISISDTSQSMDNIAEEIEGSASTYLSSTKAPLSRIAARGKQRSLPRNLPSFTLDASDKPFLDSENSADGYSSDQQERGRSSSLSKPRVDQPSKRSSQASRRLSPPIDDIERRKFMEDLMSRRSLKFERENARSMASKGERIPESDMYAVYSPQAIRPWDSPHAHRAETHVVLLLSDVFGWENENTRCVADQVAEICNAIVLVPDIFRGHPWNEECRQDDYEEWRASHDPVRAFALRSCCFRHTSAFTVRPRQVDSPYAAKCN